VQFTGSRQVSEILTLYELDIDAEYFQGKTNEPLPYRERFAYRNLSPEDLAAPAPGTVWVLKSAALPASLPEGWEVRDFDSYCLLFYQGG
jgi:hypothetical protein